MNGVLDLADWRMLFEISDRLVLILRNVKFDIYFSFNDILKGGYIFFRADIFFVLHFF